ncbi:MAG: hypothetical protein KAT05_03785 [Spirochaetes bacterium]|nr:hypothetical protein [Spirochaetota bacterium]
MNKLIIKTTDIYEIVWYLTFQTTVIESIEVLPRGKQSICQFAISGDNLNELQNDYLNNRACLNLKEFRKILCQVNGLIEKARKEVKQQASNQLIRQQVLDKAGRGGPK